MPIKMTTHFDAKHKALCGSRIFPYGLAVQRKDVDCKGCLKMMKQLTESIELLNQVSSNIDKITLVSLLDPTEETERLFGAFSVSLAHLRQTAARINQDWEGVVCRSTK